MTRRCVADDQFGQLQRRLGEIARRVDEGSIPFDDTMLRLQQVAENCTPKAFQLYWSQETVAELLAKGNYCSPVRKGVEKYLSLFTTNINERGWMDFCEFRVEFLPFDDPMSTRNFLESARTKGLKRLSPVQALRFGMQHPDLQRHHTLHFVPEQMPWIEASDLGVHHFSNFTAYKSGPRYLVLDGNRETRRSIYLAPLYDGETSRPYSEQDWFGFRRDLPRSS